VGGEGGGCCHHGWCLCDEIRRQGRVNDASNAWEEGGGTGTMNGQEPPAPVCSHFPADREI